MMTMSFGSGRSWGGDFGPDWGGGGRGSRRRMFGSGELRLLLLKLIADQPRHGYDLIRAIEEMTGGRYAPSPGIVYPTLTMLLDMGLVDEAKRGGARKAFQVTPEGVAQLTEHQSEVDALVARLAALGDEQKRAGGAPVRRAVGNLLSALWTRATREDADEEVLYGIAGILDEAARKIERLK